MTEQQKTCSREGCDKPASERSTKGYCVDCMKSARAAWRAMIAEGNAEREARYAEFLRVWNDAMIAGAMAAATAVPRMIVAVEHANPLDDDSPATKVSEPFPICGFGWLRVFPGNSSFAHWLVKTQGARVLDRGGVHWPVMAHGQSYDRKMAHAQAMAAALMESGVLGSRVKVYAGGALD